MTPTLMTVIYMALLTWLTLLGGSFFRERVWTIDGVIIAFGNRDNLPPPSALSGRADRTASNTMENFVLFAAIALTIHAAGLDNERVATGAQMFFWARVVYVPVYYAGITYLRSAIWLIGVIGIGMMLAAL
jgi:uncharacterized MAPEG superfamily protein